MREESAWLCGWRGGAAKLRCTCKQGQGGVKVGKAYTQYANLSCARLHALDSGRAVRSAMDSE